MANISIDTFVESKGYDKVILQQGVPITDYDWNEAQDIQRFKIRRIVKELFGDGAIGDGFKVMPTSPASSSVLVKSGTLYVDGYRVRMNTDATLPLPASPTSGTRKDIVYAEITEQEVDSIIDPDIKHPKLESVEPTRRIKISVNLKVGTSVPADTETVKHYGLAEVNRSAGVSTISAANIVDLRSVKATFEGEGFEVRGNVTLGDAENDIINIRGAIKNTSSTFGGAVYVDDALKISGDVNGLGKGFFAGDLRTDGLLFVKGSIKNDASTNAGAVLVDDNLTINGETTVNGSPISITRDVASSDQTVLRFNGTGGKEWHIKRGNTNGQLYFRNETDAKTALTLSTSGTTFTNYNVTVSTNLTVSGTSTLNGNTTIGSGRTFTVTNGQTLLQYNHATNPTLLVDQDGAGVIARFRGAGDAVRMEIKNDGSIDTKGGIVAVGDIITQGKIVQIGKPYEVARLTLFGIAGDLQYQSDSTTFEDIIPTLYRLFATDGTTALPAPAAGATRVYKLLVVYSQDNGSAQVTVRLTDGTNTPISFNLPKFAGGLDNGERRFALSNEFTQASTTTDFKLQAKTTGGNMTIMNVELIAYDVY